MFLVRLGKGGPHTSVIQEQRAKPEKGLVEVEAEVEEDTTSRFHGKKKKKTIRWKNKNNTVLLVKFAGGSESLFTIQQQQKRTLFFFLFEQPLLKLRTQGKIDAHTHI